MLWCRLLAALEYRLVRCKVAADVTQCRCRVALEYKGVRRKVHSVGLGNGMDLKSGMCNVCSTSLGAC
jgi:hypothetical protein